MIVACVFVKGNYPYTLEYVVRLERMARKFLTRAFRFVCLTDQPEAVTAVGIEAIAVSRLAVSQAYWHKLHLFNPAHRLTGRVLFLDLDVLVIGDLAPIVDYPAPFALAADELALERPTRDTNAIGQTIIRQFNASVMAWDAGTLDTLWQAWTPKIAARLQGDQDWYAERMPNAQAMPVSWFPRLSRVQPPWAPDAKVVLVKKPKNHISAAQWPWFDALWGAR
jgi:hypothetical protein